MTVDGTNGAPQEPLGQAQLLLYPGRVELRHTLADDVVGWAAALQLCLDGAKVCGQRLLALQEQQIVQPVPMLHIPGLH